MELTNSNKAQATFGQQVWLVLSEVYKSVAKAAGVQAADAPPGPGGNFSGG